MPNRSNPGEIILFVKNPEPGQVKTRLAKTAGPQTASQIYSHMSRTLFWRMQEAGLNPVIAFHPPKSKRAVQALFKHAKAYLPQVPGGLGEKMRAAILARLSQSTKLLLIGTDCIDLSASDCRAALKALDRAPVVLGPANDGGYYLLGVRSSEIAHERVVKALFQGIEWSTSRVLRQTTNQLNAIDMEYILLKAKSDVDTACDLNSKTLLSLLGAPSILR